MSIYDVDYNRQGVELLPPDKRFPKQIAWIYALLTPLQWLRDLIFTSYRTGSTAPAYAPGTYAKYQQVIFKQAVYVSLIDSNTASPIDTASWLKIQDNFLGAEQRVLYDGQKIVLEYALNQWFGTYFRQPPNVSDIYLTMHPKPPSVFVIGGDETNSSKVYSNKSSEYVVDSYAFTPYYNMTINVPIAVWTALDTVVANRDKFVRSFADQYVVAGIIYNIATY